MSETINDTRKAEFQRYREALERSRDDALDFPWLSSGAERATIANEILIGSAVQRVRIFASDSDLGPLGSLADTSLWLRPGVRVDVLVRSEQMREDIDAGPLRVRVALGDFYPYMMRAMKSINHFVVIDDRSYRREYDTNNHTGPLNFNDPTEAARLAAIFDAGFDRTIVQAPTRTLWQKIFFDYGAEARD